MSDNYVHQAVILAGGKGTRLKNTIGNEIPKCLAPVYEKPLINYQLEQFQKFGIQKVLILGCHLIDQISEHIKSQKFDFLDIQVVEEVLPRGTAGAVYDALDFLDDIFVISYGDLVFDINLKNFFDTHRKLSKNGAEMSLLLHRSNHPQDADLVDVDEKGFVKSFHSYPHEKPFRTLTNSAIYMCEKKILKNKNFLKEGILDFGRDILPALIEDNIKIGSYISTEYLIDIGVKDRFLDATQDQISEKPKKLRLSNPRNLRIFYLKIENEICEDFDKLFGKKVINDLIECNKCFEAIALIINNLTSKNNNELEIVLEYYLSSLGCTIDFGLCVTNEKREIKLNKFFAEEIYKRNKPYFQNQIEVDKIKLSFIDKNDKDLYKTFNI